MEGHTYIFKSQPPIKPIDPQNAQLSQKTVDKSKRYKQLLSHVSHDLRKEMGEKKKTALNSLIKKEKTKNEIRDIRNQSVNEIDAIKAGILQFNNRLGKTLPSIFLRSREFDKLKGFNLTGISKIQQIDECMRKIKQKEETLNMTIEDDKGFKRRYTESNDLLINNLVLYEDYEHIINQNQSSIESLKKNISYKNQEDKAKKQLESLNNDFQTKLNEIDAIKKQMEENNKEIDKFYKTNRDVFLACIDEKDKLIKTMMDQLTDEDKVSFIDKINEFSKYDLINFEKRVKQVEEKEYSIGTVNEIYIKFNKGLEEIGNELIIITDNNVSMASFIAKLSESLENVYKRYIDNANLFIKRNRLNKRNTELDQQINSLHCSKMECELVISVIHKNMAEEPKVIDEQINYDYLAESLTESFFLQSNASLHKMEMKEQIDMKKLEEIIEAFESIEWNNEELMIKINSINKQRERLREYIESIAFELQNMYSGISESKKELVKALCDENTYLNYLLDKKTFYKYEKKIRDKVIQFCTELTQINLQFQNKLKKTKFNSLQQLLNLEGHRKIEFLKQHMRKEKKPEPITNKQQNHQRKEIVNKMKNKLIKTNNLF